MAIDRIGKNAPAAPPVAAPLEPPRTDSAAARRAFDVTGGATGATGADVAAATASPALARVKAGEIDVAGYVDLKVDEATAHLTGIPPEELASLRSALRDRLAGDPTLVDLVRAATGMVPPPTDDG